MTAPRLSALLGSLFLSPSIALAAGPAPIAGAPSVPTTTPPAVPTAAAPNAPNAPAVASPADPTSPVVEGAPPPPPPPPPPSPGKPRKGAPPKAAAASKPVAPAADAKKPDDSKKVEAAQRFDRGLELFDQGDNAGALAEFKRTYEILPNPVVLYNIGLVYAAMGRPVDAVDALDQSVNSGGLSAKQLERAKQTLNDQKARIGRLSVTTTPDGAHIEVDNVEVATTPLAQPVRISEGSHIIGAVAEGYAPARKEVVIAGNSDAAIHLDLVPTQGKQLANLTVRGTAGAEVRVDNEVLGKTPLETSITLVAGHHVVELRRPGYGSARREVDVGEGATGEIEVQLAVDPSALGTEGATLALDASEPSVDLTVDGEHKGVYRDPLRLPRGPHHLTVIAAGFLPVDRDVDLDPGQTNVVRVQLDPTPEKRAQIMSNARFHQTWGWIGVISGAVIAGGGAALVAVGSSNKSDATNQINSLNDKQANDVPPCDQASGYAAEMSLPKAQQQSYTCDTAFANAQNKYDSGKTLVTTGYIGIGVGGALLVTGVVLLLTGESTDKYDHPASHTLGKNRPPKFALVPGPGQFGQGFQLAF
ncbi:MAG TPA: PEGA domain-containing protein [Polyangiaceae bacterium]|nr:PEGA domain-containing protein [Polyangiaceae bacterium]